MFINGLTIKIQVNTKLIRNIRSIYEHFVLFIADLDSNFDNVHPDFEYDLWTKPDCAGTEFENANRYLMLCLFVKLYTLYNNCLQVICVHLKQIPDNDAAV